MKVVGSSNTKREMMAEELSADSEEDAFSFRQGEMIGEKNDRLER